jgi:predicted O-methyltransferase YrrM
MKPLLLTYELIEHLIKTKSRKGHGVHSPFMYDLCRNVLMGKGIPEGAKRALELRGQLKTDRRPVQRLDLGAGNRRGAKVDKLAHLARTSSASPGQIRFLGRMAAHFRPTTILEMGTCLGLGAISMAGSSPGSHVHTIEGCPETAQIAGENFKKAGQGNIKQHVGRFDDLLPGLLNELKTVGLAYIDGNHKGAAALRYFGLLLPYSTDNTVLVFDDIRWSKDMLQAWKRIKNHAKVRACMDLFTMGVVFFRSGLAHQHYRFWPRF